MAKYKSGYTLVEVIITIAVLAVISLGTMGYQFHAVQQAKTAQAKMTAMRLGSLILENWRSQGGSDAYDPTALNLGIVELNAGEKYYYVINDVPFYLNLFKKDIDTNSTTGVTLRQLSVFVQWRADYQEMLPGNSDPGSTLFTYVRRDQSGG
ncbi:MAG: type II secretion system protein [Deltaproteobacteria bacterium]|nr:type II secretion system protein [Deltaproteobacteria bacterium]